MKVLIIVSNPELGRLWARHLSRNGATVVVADSEEAAIDELGTSQVDIIVVDIVLTTGSAIAIADFACCRQPGAKVIFVSNSTFFSDGSIFQHIPNACAVMPAEVQPSDLEAVVEHYAGVTS